MRKLPQQELLTINYSFRYPNFSAPPLLMQMTVEPAGSFGAHALPNTRHLLTVTLIQRTNGKVSRRVKLRYWPRIGAHLHFIAAHRRQTAASHRLLIRFFFSQNARRLVLPIPFRITIAKAIEKIPLVSQDIVYMYSTNCVY